MEDNRTSQNMLTNTSLNISPTFSCHLPTRAADSPPAASMIDMGYVASSRLQSDAADTTNPCSLASAEDIADQP